MLLKAQAFQPFHHGRQAWLHVFYLATFALLPASFGQGSWTYRDQNAWAARWPSCGVIDQQAPVDLRMEKAEHKGPAGGWSLEAPWPGVQSLGPLAWHAHWPMVNVTLSAGGGTWTASLAKEYVASTWISLFGTDYYLESFHYHSPSEMWVDGRGFDMEVQFFHRSIDGRALVLSVLLQVGLVAPNQFMSQFFNDMPIPGESPVHKYMFSPYSELGLDALPKDRTFFAFNASLSEPPCTLDTLWVVFQKPVIINYSQREKFRRVLNTTQEGFLRYETCCPNGVIMPWAIDGDVGVVGMNNRVLQNHPVQAVLVKMKASLVATVELQESHVWIVSIAVGLLLALLFGGLCVTIVLMCNAVDRPELRREKIGGKLLHKDKSQAVEAYGPKLP